MKMGKYRISLKNKDLLILVIMFGWAAAYYAETAGMRQAKLMLALIQPVFIIMLALGLIYVVKNIKIETAEPSGESAPSVPFIGKAAAFLAKNSRYLGFTAIMFAYLLVMNYLGFVTGTILYLFSTMYYLGLRKVHLLILIPLIATFAIYFIFGKFFYVKLPEGILL